MRIDKQICISQIDDINRINNDNQKKKKIHWMVVVSPQDLSMIRSITAFFRHHFPPKNAGGYLR